MTCRQAPVHKTPSPAPPRPCEYSPKVTQGVKLPLRAAFQLPRPQLHSWNMKSHQEFLFTLPSFN